MCTFFYGTILYSTTQAVWLSFAADYQLFFLIQIFFQPASAGDSLNLTRADSVRVALFSLNRPDSLLLSNHSASLILYSVGRADTLSSAYAEGSLFIDGDQLTFQNKQTLAHVDSLVLLTDSLSTRLITDDHGYRHYSGRLRFKPAPFNRGIFIVNTIDLETYIESVVGSEMDFKNPEALKTQAVVSRNYALWSMQKSSFREFDLHVHESSHVYIGNILDKPHYTAAAKSTVEEILTWSNQLILAAFSSTCGGSKVNNTDVWGGRDHPYLSIQQDADACSNSPHYSWTHTIQVSDFSTLTKQYYGFEFVDKQIRKDISGRVRKVMITGPADDNLSYTGHEFRTFINRHAQPRSIRSTKYTWTLKNGTSVLRAMALVTALGYASGERFDLQRPDGITKIS